MNIIDSHIHLWDLKNKYNQWVFSSNQLQHLQQNFTLETVKKSLNHRLKGIVHIEAHDSDIDTLYETQWLIKQAQNNPDIQLKIIAYTNILQEPETFKLSLERLKAYPQIIGIRHILAYHPISHYNPTNLDESANPNLIENLNILAKYNLIFDAQFYPKQWLKLVKYLDKFTGKIILEHLVLPLIDNTAEFGLWLNALKSIKKMESVYVKVSGFNMLKEDFNLDHINMLLKHLTDTIGIDRLIYGSNFPVDYHQNYSYWLNILNQTDLAEIDKQKLLFDNANQFYGFNITD